MVVSSGPNRGATATDHSTQRGPPAPTRWSANTPDDDLDNFIETIDDIKRRFNGLQPKAGPKLAELSDALDELLKKLHRHPQYQQSMTLRKKLLEFKQHLKEDLEAHSSEPNSGPLVPDIPPLAHHW